MPISSTLDANFRRGDVFCGRLVAMASQYFGMTGPVNSDSANTISVDFPSMPDEVELMRSTDYNVATSPQWPDGIHTYRGTKPLEIPFSFSLHAFDKQYCKNGALTLLKLAARLHSFTLPIDPTGTVNALANAKASVPTGTDVSSTAAKAQMAQSQNIAAAATVGMLTPPITCWLFLMATDQSATSPGISAVGYVKDVSVKLKGPWLRGPNGSFNLPSSGDFSFTFVHCPGYGNASFISSSATESAQLGFSVAALADDVKSRLYNTRNLVVHPNYQSFNSGDATVDQSAADIQ